MSVEAGYIDTGDRIVVKATGTSNGFGSSTLKDEHVGMHGIVVSNDGYGNCRVKLDNGEYASCWNGQSLDFEAKQ